MTKVIIMFLLQFRSYIFQNYNYFNLVKESNDGNVKFQISGVLGFWGGGGLCIVCAV